MTPRPETRSAARVSTATSSGPTEGIWHDPLARHPARCAARAACDREGPGGPLQRDDLQYPPRPRLRRRQRLAAPPQGADRPRRLLCPRSRRDAGGAAAPETADRSEEHTSELQSLMRISSAVFCLKKKKTIQHEPHRHDDRLS